ncbi:hypothetical protein JF078_003704 [Salmonella enterica]|nr:hypothetical protein [Salmonella enterica]EBS4770471.1 hypothetical protein [Salmonella enterica subsp. enterica serovar Sandiego]ECU4587606.1 hypothetical protein [Salmonella enterica subsp. enterica]EDK5852745.1 hypothetical protein [Salmonella enterica subsp. enterica serovar Newport]EDQ5102786.1 hypothetical protein [Salmonella enterica subsp. enterica serovar Saintpaul]EDU6561914.1 hypothetical protein [Salmonella enterica subsp. enterica serovar Miami]EDX2040574.1 hypothetical protei
MEVFWIVAGIVVVILFIISQNRTKISDRTTVTTRKTIKTEDGEIQIHRTQTVDSAVSQYHAPKVATTPPKAEYDLEAIHGYYKAEEQKAVSSIPPQSAVKIVQEIPKPAIQVVTTPASAPATVVTQDEIEKKKCKRCHRSLILDRFGSNPKSSDGRTVWCRECLDAPRDTAKQKYCPKCKRRRMRTSFYTNTNRKDGLTLWCKDCMDKSNRR